MITRIILNNYRSYEKLDKNFSDGLNIIQGRNATGKSTIVEAIGYALQGSSLQKGTASNWIKEGESVGSVTLYIDNFVITRGNKKQIVKDIEGNIIARGHTGINEWVVSVYGLSPELYKTSFHIAQKEISAFAGLGPIEKTKRVEKLLRLDIIDKIKQEAQLARRDVLSKYVLIESIMSNLEPYTKQDLEETKKDLLELEKELKDLRQEEIEQATIVSEYNTKVTMYNKKIALENRLLDSSLSSEDLKLKIQEAEDKKAQNLEILASRKLYDEKVSLMNILQNVDIQEKYFTRTFESCVDLKNSIKNSNFAQEKLKEYTKAELACENSEDTIDTLNRLKVNILELTKQIDILKNKPLICPTCGQDMPDVADMSTEIERLETKLKKLKVSFVKREKSFNITELKKSIFKTIYSLADIEIMLNSIKFKDKYLRLNELKDIDEPKEKVVSASYLNSLIVDFKYDLSLRSRLEEYKEVTLPEPIEIKKFKIVIAELVTKEHELNKKLNSIEQTLDTKEKNSSTLKKLTEDKVLIEDFIKFIASYRNAFSAKIIPMIEENANKIVNYLSEGKIKKLNLENSYSIRDYDLYSGAEEDSANFALRLAIAQISRLGSYNTIVLDEIAASYDNIREDRLIDVLKSTDMQIIYISHGDVNY